MLVLTAENRPAFLPRLLAELGSSGFDVALVTVPTFPPARSEIERLAQQEGTTVELLLVDAGAGLEIWIVDPATGTTTFREVILGLYESHEAPEVIATRVAETLRATLMEFANPHASAPPIRLGRLPATGSSPPRAAPHWTMAVGGGGAYSAGGLAMMELLELSFAYEFGSRFRVALDGALTPTRTTLRGSEGQASIAWYVAGVSLGFSPGNPAAPVRFRSSAGAWLGSMSLAGQAVAPYVNTPTEFVSVIPHLDEGLHFSLTPTLGLVAGVSIGVSAPGASIRFAGREVATWGRPLWIGSLALEAALDR